MAGGGGSPSCRAWKLLSTVPHPALLFSKSAFCSLPAPSLSQTPSNSLGLFLRLGLSCLFVSSLPLSDLLS